MFRRVHIQFLLQKQAAPKSWTEKVLSPIHAQFINLIGQLPDDTRNYVCGMDNLYISPKFANVMLNQSGRRVIIHGVFRPSRGIKKCIVQDKVTKKNVLI